MLALLVVMLLAMVVFDVIAVDDIKGAGPARSSAQLKRTEGRKAGCRGGYGIVLVTNMSVPEKLFP